MKTSRPMFVSGSFWGWFLLTNIVLLGFTFYVHASLDRHGWLEHNHAIEGMAIWLLTVFKIVGANLILIMIFSEFKNR